MNGYRRGAVLGLTIAETFILLTFLLLMALLGLVPQDEPTPGGQNGPGVWVPPETIEALSDAANEARNAQENAESERDQAREKAEEARRAKEEAEWERDKARGTLALFRRKGEKPPCWYQTVNDSAGKTREKSYYAFNAAIYEDSILLAPRPPPPGGAVDDGGGSYVEEWHRLRMDELPYGKPLSDGEFAKAISDMVAQGRNGQVRTYECVFSVMVWDMTPDHAKERWKDAHDRIVEGSFSAYTVRDLEWTGGEPEIAADDRPSSRPMHGSRRPR